MTGPVVPPSARIPPEIQESELSFMSGQWRRTESAMIRRLAVFTVMLFLLSQAEVSRAAEHGMCKIIQLEMDTKDKTKYGRIVRATCDGEEFKESKQPPYELCKAGTANCLLTGYYSLSFTYSNPNCTNICGALGCFQYCP
jgi:hypothetical protein